jgi:Effector-associated domain 11
MSNTQNFIAQIRILIGKDDLPTAIQQLSTLLKNSPRLDEAILHSARYNNVIQQIRLGLVDFNSANIAKNQIRHGILELLREIEEQLKEPIINTEVEQFTIKIEKNIVKDTTITAGGNVTIGDTIHTESKISRNVRLFMYVFVPLLAISVAYLYNKSENLKEPLNLTVLFTDKMPNPNIPLDKVKVTLTYGDKPETQTVEKEATFKGIPPSFKREKLSLYAEAENFFIVDTEFVLLKNTLIVPLYRNNSLSKVFGTVYDENGKLLADVQVTCQDISVLSNASGQFKLPISSGKQRKVQRIRFFKQGFQLRDNETPIIENEDMQVILKK